MVERRLDCGMVRGALLGCHRWWGGTERWVAAESVQHNTMMWLFWPKQSSTRPPYNWRSFVGLRLVMMMMMVVPRENLNSVWSIISFANLFNKYRRAILHNVMRYIIRPVAFFPFERPHIGMDGGHLPHAKCGFHYTHLWLSGHTGEMASQSTRAAGAANNCWVCLLSGGMDEGKGRT